MKLFHARRPDQERYYRGVGDALVERDRRNPLFQLLALEVSQLFGHAPPGDWPFVHATEALGTRSSTCLSGRSEEALATRCFSVRAAHSWIGSGGVPATVANSLAGTDFEISRIMHGFFEREVDLRTRGRRSQTDLMLLVETSAGPAVVAVEGKARERFGPVVADWLLSRDGTPSETKRARLDGLCGVLGLTPGGTEPLRYQLLHRSVSAIFEAQRYGCDRALVLVHSFAGSADSFGDLQKLRKSSRHRSLANGSLASSHVRRRTTRYLLDRRRAYGGARRGSR